MSLPGAAEDRNRLALRSINQVQRLVIVWLRNGDAARAIWILGHAPDTDAGIAVAVIERFYPSIELIWMHWHTSSHGCRPPLWIVEQGDGFFKLKSMVGHNCPALFQVSRAPSILAVADHTGWAHVVSVSARERRPFVVTRRRIVLIDHGLPTQPFEHDTMAMRPDEAQALVADVRKSIATNTDRALQRLVDGLSREHPVKALTIRKPPFPKLPATVAEAHASQRLQYAADGMLYNLAMCAAATGLGLDVQSYRRGDEMDLAAAALGVSAEAIEEFVSVGRPAGPPWTAEHRRAYAAGSPRSRAARGRLTIA